MDANIFEIYEKHAELCPKARPETRVPEDPKLAADMGGEKKTTQREKAVAGDPHLSLLLETFHRERRRLLSLPGVTGIDIGYKIEESTGKITNELAIRIHLEQKLDEKWLRDKLGRARELIPKTYPPNPKAGEFSVKTDVIQTSYAPQGRRFHVVERPVSNQHLTDMQDEQLRQSRVNPLVGGISVGSQSCPGGTLGCLVWDRRDGSVCILGNWHVLAGQLPGKVGSPCFQPGLFDHGVPGDEVARLRRWSLDRHTDAALAELTGNRRYCSGEILSLPNPIIGTVQPYLGMVVFKSGRSTCFTYGFVDGLYFTSAITYGNGVVQLFEDQIHIAPFSPLDRLCEPGDSGAIWLTLDGKGSNQQGLKAVGLHFAGNLPHSTFGEFAIANPIAAVQERLNFSFRPLFLDESQPTSSQALQIPPAGSFPPGGNTATAPAGFATGLTGPGGQPVPDTKDSGG